MIIEVIPEGIIAEVVKAISSYDGKIGSPNRDYIEARMVEIEEAIKKVRSWYRETHEGE